MTPAASYRATSRRLIWVALLVVALLGRALAPAGWMPVANAAGGFEVTLCDGQGPMPVMVMTSDGTLHKKVPARAPTGDHPCAFAGMAVADTAPPMVEAAAPSPAKNAEAPASPSVAVPGRGLASPPPPATGPPALA
jgi:hypothetical protein